MWKFRLIFKIGRKLRVTFVPSKKVISNKLRSKVFNIFVKASYYFIINLRNPHIKVPLAWLAARAKFIWIGRQSKHSSRIFHIS
jgi:hypothetical protein